MTKNHKQLGLYYLGLLTALLAISELAFRFIVDAEIEETIVKVIIVGTPLIFAFKRYTWAKWLTTLVLTLNGFLNLLGALELGSQGLYAIGLFNLFFAIALHVSRKIKLFLLDLDELPSESENPKPNTYPYLLSRYKAALIDGLFLFGLFAATMILTPNPEFRPTAFGVYILVSILYEPVMLSIFAGTIGHKMLGMKVKRSDDINRNINMLDGLLRITSKFLLGWLSFLTINFSAQHRAIHDYVGSSIVIDDKTAPATRPAPS